MASSTCGQRWTWIPPPVAREWHSQRPSCGTILSATQLHPPGSRDTAMRQETNHEPCRSPLTSRPQHEPPHLRQPAQPGNSQGQAGTLAGPLPLSPRPTRTPSTRAAGTASPARPAAPRPHDWPHAGHVQHFGGSPETYLTKIRAAILEGRHVCPVRQQAQTEAAPTEPADVSRVRRDLATDSPQDGRQPADRAHPTPVPAPVGRATADVRRTSRSTASPRWCGPGGR